jgi:hypothetical protein
MRFIFRFSILAAVGAVAILLPVTGASAQAPERGAAPACLPHGQVEGQLRHTYNEKKLGSGVSGDGNLIEIYMSSAGNFTVIKTSPAGVSCIVDFGEGWQTIDHLETALLNAPEAPQYADR